MEGKSPAKLPVETATAAQPASSAQAPTMSKNRRDRLQNEVKQIEDHISRLEAEMRSLEEGFANPAPEMNWEISHRRLAAIQEELDALYTTLAAQWEQMGL